ncbi:hypothetical protein [Crocosphaera watsonii]|uniref:DUF1508 domain-containing protein n=2 Tax=Crocosphaera watsonii TaxID=263511 RepID=T2JIF0_CROWT|nr:hypothetical protein [Crocosphaera watsonii]CCQ55108.1 hypothetical protein CWATWH0005_5345 [Crocosphaera watsonii WH 0005]CCQ64886.1 hypothetical protein CWATWH0402_2397 [Crocosphaera watsonii WH 0402]
MSSFRVHSLIVCPKHLLLVFYTDRRAYQFRVVNNQGKIFGTTEIFYTENAAENAARKCLVEQNL